MTHNIAQSEAHLDPRLKFMAREVSWYAPRKSSAKPFLAGALVAFALLFIAGLAIAGTAG